MKKADAQTVLETAQAFLQNSVEGALTSAEIAAAVDRVLGLNPRWSATVDRSAVIKELETRFSVWIGRAHVLENNEGHEAWLTAERKQGWRLWPRYRQFLEQAWSPHAVDALDETSDEVISRIEDPARQGSWDRRGLVVGHVQSGKTSSYTGVICKAADAGYRVIIVLAGIHKNLRSQTQMRLDEGFLGYETMPSKGAATGELRSIGVGLIDPDPHIRPDYITNRSDNGDFSKAVARNLGITPGARPMLFVVKKNKRVLGNLCDWVEGVANGRPALADVPLLIIDDEADHASVDTGAQAFDENGKPDPDHDPKEINRLIRRLLMWFEKRVYVGYTATPFANIFIHEQGRTKEEGEDLFPRSFIVNLPTPSNYDGPVRLFGLSPDDDGGDGAAGLPLVRTIKDHVVPNDPSERTGWMPPLHKNAHRPLYEGEATVPPSLREAILAFVLVCAARRARGSVDVHNSMLVHVTRFTKVQTLVREQVQAELDSIQRRLRFGDSGPESIHSRLEKLWATDFGPTTRNVAGVVGLDIAATEWQALRPLLSAAADNIHVREINGTAKDALDYDVHKTTGFNVIAVGGDKLARGLTLEGLSISYFLRASRMYDTLMQMGRWFGYRPGYLDLCRLYTTSDLKEWFAHITDAAEELRTEFDHMQAVGGTPKDYGLKVRSHPILMVTSRVKMRNATPLTLTFSGALQETVVFHRSSGDLETNLKAAATLLASLGGPTDPDPKRDRPGGKRHTWKNSRVWKDVDGALVAKFLGQSVTHPDGVKVNTKVLADFVTRQIEKEMLTQWHVALFAGEDEERHREIAGLKCFMNTRAVNIRGYDTLEQAMIEHARRNKYPIRRLLAPRDEAIDLTEKEYEEALELTRLAWQADPARSRRQTPPDVPSGPAIRAVRGRLYPERGLLLLYPLDPTPAAITFEEPVIGFGVSFPKTKNSAPVTYTVNNVYWEQELGETV